MPLDVTWPLLDEPPTPRLPVTPPADPGYAQSVQLGSDPLIGAGILRPFQRDVKQDWANDSGARILNTSVGQILGTMSDGPTTTGELPWRPEFGSKLYLLRNKLNSGQLGQVARRHVVDALSQWEPRIKVTGTHIKRFMGGGQKGNNVMLIRVTYDIVSTGDSSNDVSATGLETTVAV